MYDATGALDTSIPLGAPPAGPSVTAMGAAAIASAALAACGGGGGGGSTGANPSNPSSVYAYSAPQTNADAARFLLQAQFHSSDADIAAVKAAGYGSWLQTQVSTASSQSGSTWLDLQGVGVPANKFYFNPGSTDGMIWNQLMAAPDGARRRMALALSEIIVVSTNPMDGYWPQYAMAAYWDILCKYAFGNYRQLLEAITLNLAMGKYLNTKGNKKADGNGSAPDENYAREVMQLFSVGLVLLNMDGTPKLGSDGLPIDTYSNADITQLAQVFTGFDSDTSQDNPLTPVQGSGATPDQVPQTTYTSLPMVQILNGRNHSSGDINGEVTFLNVKVNITSPLVGLGKALDILYNHPNTAPFISKQLIQRLTTSNPTTAYVQRVAQVFANNGSGVRGDLAAVFVAILQDDEARSPSGLVASQFGKLREPMLRLVQWARTFNVTSINGKYAIGDLSNAGTALGQSPLRAPSVFNFFRPGYVPSGTTLSAGAVAPEFQLINESSTAGYLNYMQNVIDTGLVSGDMVAAYTAEIAVAEKPTSISPSALVDRINLLMAGGQLSTTTTTLITNTVGAMAGTVASTATTATNLRRRVCATVLLTMASTEYLVQK